MRKRMLHILVFSAAVCGSARAIENEQAQAFMGQDLHLRGPELISHKLDSGEHVLVFSEGFSMSIGANHFSSGSAVVWVQSLAAHYVGNVRAGYRAVVYLGGEVLIEKGPGALTTALHQVSIEDGAAQVVWFAVSGEVFVTAQKRKVEYPSELELYTKAVAGLEAAGLRLGVMEVEFLGPEPVLPTEAVEAEPKFRYPINLAPAGEVPPEITSPGPNEPNVLTVIGRFYLWQKQDEEGGLLELQADSAVIFYSSEKAGAATGQAEDILASGAVMGIYLAGDVLMTKGQRTIRADELYYDFERTRAVVKNAEMRNFDETEGIPIYVRAAELRQLSEHEFAARDVTLTTSEFHRPQLSVNASSIRIKDTTSTDAQQDGVRKDSYEAQMEDVRFDVYGRTIFYWPFMRSNLVRPDMPLKSAHMGHSSRWGGLLETRWYLARLLGLAEPQGTESTLALDYYTKRGLGAGIEVEYAREDYFGNVLGYVINDHGKDRLGRDATRKGLEPERDLRGRFLWQHRHFLPYNWQLTGEISYLSDLNFLESFYRDEFYLGKEQETLLHLKRIQDNWGLSFLGKVRINDFMNQLEELPTVQYHRTGQSFFDDKLTFYSDSQVSHFRQRYNAMNPPLGSEQFFTFATTRNEVDMPLSIGRAKVVPFVAGTVAYDDGMGFYRELDGGTAAREDDVWYGETGVRVSTQPYWKVFPGVKSRKWDLDQLRHVVRPHLTAVSYTQGESVAEQRDVLNVGLSQRLQTKRGPAGRQRTVDWMRLNTEITWVNDPAGASAGADRFLWNKPFIPMVNTYSTTPPQIDRRSTGMFGPQRDYFGADYTWRLSDTTAVLSDMYYDIPSSVVQQFNVGVSHMRWPDLSYYVGSRYLKRVTILDPTTGNTLQEGSNAFVFAITYVLDPRYTVVFSEQIDFDYGATIGSEITLLRRYHRMYWGLTFRTDESLDEQSIVFSIWPQGVSGLGLGPSRYRRWGAPTGY